MAAVAESVRIASEAELITSEALEESASESGASCPASGAVRPKLWSDVMSELSDSTDAPDHQSLGEREEANGGHTSGGESPGSSVDRLTSGRRGATNESKPSAQLAPLPDDLKFVVAQLHMFLAQSPMLKRVELREGALGSPAEITAELADASMSDADTKDGWILEPARQALAMSVQNSQSVYMLGYCGEAFENFYGEGFKATLGIPSDEARLCWDTWQWGYCSRPASCRCKHPHKEELLEISVFLRKPKHR